MAAIKLLCDGCGRDLLPSLLDLLNEAHGTSLTLLEVPGLASRVCLDPDFEIEDAELSLLEDMGLFLLTLLTPQDHLCDECGPMDCGPEERFGVAVKPGAAEKLN